MRPGRPRRAAVLVVALAVAFAAIARTSGAGWLVVLVAVLAGALAAGAVAPLVPLVGLRLRLAVPADAVVGDPMPVRLDASASGAVVLVRAVGLGLPWVRARAGTATAVPLRRGVVERVVVDAWCAAPLGLVAWRRRVVVALDEPVHVAPAPLPMPAPVPPPAAGRGDEVVRSVRRYQAGDPQRLVHWPSLARTGTLNVRELEAPAPQGVTVALHLDPDASDEEREAAASRAAGVVAAAQRSGLAVALATLEAGGPVVAAVRTRREAGRRLAAAVAGPLPVELPAATVHVGARA